MSDLIEILRDSIWGFIFGVTSIILYLHFHKSKKLSYDIVSNTPLFDVHEEIEERLQVIFDGKPIKDIIHLIIVKITNSGNIPIKCNDYSNPISLNLGENARIFPPVEILKKNPEDLKVSVNIEDSKVIIMPNLLNRGNSITLKVLGTQISDDIIVSGHIVGGEIKKISEEVKSLKFLFVVYLFPVCMFILLANMMIFIIDFLKFSDVLEPFFMLFSILLTYYISKSLYNWLLSS